MVFESRPVLFSDPETIQLDVCRRLGLERLAG